MPSEQRCTDLGANCICSEPLQMTGFTKVGDYFNPNDTTTKECSLLDPPNNSQPISRPGSLIIDNDSQVLGSLPSGHSVARYLRGGVDHSGIFDVGHNRGFPDSARVSHRWYQYWSQDFEFTGDGDCPNAKFIHGFQVPIAGTSHQLWNSSMYGAGNNSNIHVHNTEGEFSPDISCCTSGPGGTWGNDVTLLRGHWWRVEVVQQNLSGPGYRFIAYGHNVTDGGGQKVFFDIWTFNNNLTPLSRAKGVAVNMFRGFPCRGWEGVMYFMCAAWDTDSGQRIGPAEEVEGGGGGGDTTPPLLSSLNTGTSTADGTDSASIDTNEADGTLYWAVLTDGGVCTTAQLKAGSGGNIVAGKSGNQVVNSTGTQTIPNITGLSGNTSYELTFLQSDSDGNDSSQISGGFSTLLTDTTAPVLTSADAGTPSSDGTTGASVITDEGNGQLYVVVALASATAPDAEQVEAQTDGDDAAAAFAAIQDIQSTPSVVSLQRIDAAALGNGSATITVPADVDHIVFAFGGFDNGVDAQNIASMTVAGNAVTFHERKNEVSATSADYIGFASYESPAAGAQTLAWTYNTNGAIEFGGAIYCLYVQDGNVGDFLRDAETQNELGVTTEVTVTSAINDLVIAYAKNNSGDSGMQGNDIGPISTLVNEIFNSTTYQIETFAPGASTTHIETNEGVGFWYSGGALALKGSSGSQFLFDITGLTANASYVIYFMQKDLAGNRSNVASAAFATGEVPVLSNETIGTLIYDLGSEIPPNHNGAGFSGSTVDTTGDDGTLYWMILIQDGTATSAEMIAGEADSIYVDANHGNVFSGSQAVTGSGTQPGLTFTKCWELVNLRLAYLHVSAAGAESNIVYIDFTNVERTEIPSSAAGRRGSFSMRF